MTTKRDEIELSLQDAFSPSYLKVADVSEAHRGHAGFQEGGESHFDVAIQSEAFTGLSRIQQHRAIHKAIGPEMMGRIHALAIQIKI